MTQTGEGGALGSYKHPEGSMGFERLSLTMAVIALYWAAVVNVAYSPSLLPSDGVATGWWVWVFCTLAHGVTAALGLRFLAHRDALTVKERRVLLGIACVLADVGMLLLFYVPRSGLAVEACGAGVLGVGVAILFVAWLKELVRTTSTRLVWVLSGWSHLGGLLLSALTATLPLGMGRAATLAMVPMAALCLVRIYAVSEDEKESGQLPAIPGVPVEPLHAPDERSKTPRAPIPLGMLLCCVLFCIPMGIFRAANGDGLTTLLADWRAILAEASFILGAVMLIDLLSPRLRESRFFYRLIVPLLAGGMLMSVFLTNDPQTAGMLIVTATALFLVYVYYALGCLYDGFDKASYFGVTMAVLALDLGMVVGALAGSMLRTTTLPVALELAMGLLYILLLVGMWVFPRAFEWLSGFDIIARSERAAGQQGGLSIVRARVDRNVPDDFARTWGLSERECKTAELLVRGYSVKAIAHELCVSENTVKTHRSHVYTKLGIHSRGELDSMLSQAKNNEPAH